MNKKLKIVITIIALCVGVIFAGTKAYATTGIAINNTTRLRKKATTNSEVVELISKGEEVEILEEDGEWYKVKYKSGKNTYVGYVRNDLLEVEEDTNKEETTSEEPSSEEPTQEESTSNEEKSEEPSTEVEIKEDDKIQLKNDIEIRLLPIIYSCKTGKVSANTEITITEVVGNWCHIEAEDSDGWILKSKVSSSQNKTAEAEVKEENKVEEKVEENKEEDKQVENNAESKETKLYVSTSTLNLREKADTNSKILTQLNQNDQVTVVKVVDDTWTQVKVNGYEGYTASQYLSDKKTTTTSRGAQEIRQSEDDAEAKKKAEEEAAAKKKAEEEAAAKKKAEEEAAAKKKAEEEAAAKKKAEEEAAAKKKAEEEAAAKKKAEEEAAAKKKAEESAAKKKAEEEAANKTSTTKTTTSSSSSKVTGADIVAYAKKFLGCKYVYGATGPTTFDCSGFTQYVYKHFGYKISRTSTSQRNDGKIIKNKSDLKIGDIVCFPGHVGIYVGDGKFIHASHTGSDVKISSLSSSYYKNKFIQGTRILDN